QDPPGPGGRRGRRRRLPGRRLLRAPGRAARPGARPPRRRRGARGAPGGRPAASGGPHGLPPAADCPARAGQLRASGRRRAGLLAAARRLKVVVTSRAVLRLSGEHGYAVPPLALPAAPPLGGSGRPPLGRLTQYDAVALFVERARAARADFAVTDEN